MPVLEERSNVSFKPISAMGNMDEVGLPLRAAAECGKHKHMAMKRHRTIRIDLIVNFIRDMVRIS